jgi:hypothetical protein
MSNDSRGTDDLFANSSEETVIENIDFSLILQRENVLISSNFTKNLHENKQYEVPVDLHEATVMEAVQGENSITKEIIAADKSFVPNHLVTNICNFPLKLYCPFCCSDCMSENKLKGHIQNEHESHLERISVDNNINSLYSCQFCHPRFYTDELVLKHILQHHQDKVITMFQEGEANKYMCVFCPYMVLTEQKQCLLAHVEETHFTEFIIFIEKKFTQIKQCEKLQYTHDIKSSSISNLNTLFMQMSTKENKDTREASIYHSECSSSSPFINQNENQLSEKDGIFFDKRRVSGIKNVRTGSEIPIRRKLGFDLPKTREINKSNKENIISCSTNMKLVTKYITKPSRIKSVSTWKSVFSLKKEINRNKSISKFITSTPNILNDLQIDIRKTKHVKNTSVTKKREEAKASKLVTAIKEDISKKYSVGDTDDDNDALQMYGTDVKAVISKPPHPTTWKMKKDSFCRWIPPAETLKQFECAICLDTFVNKVDLLNHTRRRHTGPLKLLQPSYKCCLCEAKFYKNSYLVRHCRFHHTPRCLKNVLPT